MLNNSAVVAFKIIVGYSNFSYFLFFVINIKFEGKSYGNIHQIPSVSSSKGDPINSISPLAFLIICAPINVTHAAISRENQREPALIA